MQYLLQFKINIKYKLNKENIILNTLSKLPSVSKDNNEINILNSFYNLLKCEILKNSLLTYYTTFIEVSLDFK